MESYFDILPDELIVLIIEYLDLTRENTYEKALCQLLEAFDDIQKQRFVKLSSEYMGKVYNGYIDIIKGYKLDNYVKTLSEKHRSILKRSLNFINGRLKNKSVDIGLVYYIQVSNSTERYRHLIEIYLICNIENKFYYIYYQHDWAPLEKFAEGDFRTTITIEQYDSWKDLHKVLLYDHIIKMYHKNGYPLKEIIERLKTHKKNKFGGVVIKKKEVLLKR